MLIFSAALTAAAAVAGAGPLPGATPGEEVTPSARIDRELAAPPVRPAGARLRQAVAAAAPFSPVRSAMASKVSSAAPAAAQASGPWSARPVSATQSRQIVIEQELIAEVRQRVHAAHGRESYQFVPATMISQGEVVYYTVRIRNPGPVPARNVTVVQRVPANTTYLAGSASGPGARTTFSVDGGQSFAPPAALYVNVEGKRQLASAAHYTHIRWELRNPLAPGAVALARFRAVFD